MSTQENHSFHMVNKSPWPLTGAIGAMVTLMGLIKWFHQYNNSLLAVGTVITLLTMIQWWRDVTREGTYQGLHTKTVTSGLRWGMILFIISEVLFFASFFWAFFHSSLSPTIELGSAWPPTGIKPFNPMQIPLLNTAILLASGVTVTFATTQFSWKFIQISHTSLFLYNPFSNLLYCCTSMAIHGSTIHNSGFSMWVNLFQGPQGFHGLHVIIGTTFFTTCLLRQTTLHFSSNHHFGFEAAAWYWHFVDVVWLFLYISIYWWGS
uniref:Cytochrome c oxidase subunit 3 n=1 Tax=Reticulitermes ovatilabrum TaxID=2781055 RepID=A0A7M1IA68_9NEOP|nr:cytochrome c oxidase subunit III [Reticulitermes ovatilabrum]QOQ35837.1 cytochrome c oxidase subunit 3 [Reticulitermes ovatilabrum]